MNYWKYAAIALAIILGVSYAGFAFVYSQGGGIMIAGMITGGPQPKVITLLKNSNITNLSWERPKWNTSVNILGYKTAFLYLQVSQYDKSSITPGGPPPTLTISVQFETDQIFAPTQVKRDTVAIDKAFLEVNLIGSRMWISLWATYQWAVVSMSLYLRD